MKRIALTCIALAVATGAHAEFFTGNDLLAKLVDKSDAHAYAMALGYIGGVHDAGRSVTHCSPITVNLGQLADMTRIRLEQQPTTRNLSADTLILVMLMATWPCPKKAPAGPAML